MVNEGKVEIVDEFTGRILHGRRYSEGLHQAIEAKENIRIAERNRTLATITFQNYFRMYKKLAGMTGTAETEATEFAKIYGLDVAVIPTNRPQIREDRDDLIYLNEEEKLQAIGRRSSRCTARGQPVLVGTISIEKSEKVSRLLTGLGVRHEVLNAKNHAREALIIAEAGARGAVTIATNMAGRGTDIKLGGNPEFRARRKLGEPGRGRQLPPLLAAELAAWEGDYSAVKEAGGLHVLGTERHDARRIDNQLRGRSGRQGDPGSSRFYISLDDDLMRLFGGENLKGVMSRLGMKEGEPIYHPWVNKAIERAQKRVEERNFEIRKHLLEYDDVLNEQRKFIYAAATRSWPTSTWSTGCWPRPWTSSRTSTRSSGGRKGPSAPCCSPGSRRRCPTPRAATAEEYLPLAPGQPEGARPAGPGRGPRREGGRGRPGAPEPVPALRVPAQHRPALAGPPGEPGGAARGGVPARLRPEEPAAGVQAGGLPDLRPDAGGHPRRPGAQGLPGQDPGRRAAPPRRGNAWVMPATPCWGSSATARWPCARRAPARRGARALGRPASGELREAQPERTQVRRSYPKVGRNDPCPCGSGKKYKYCHGS